MEPDAPQNQPSQPQESPNQPPVYPPAQPAQTPEASAPQTQPFQQQVDTTAALPNNSKPPVAAQILYALGFVGLLGGLLIVVITLIGANTDSASLYSAFGFGGLSGQAGAIVMGLIVIALFYLIHEIRRLKKWALIAYSTLLGFGLLFTIYEELTKNPIEKLLDSGNPIADFFVFIIIAPLLFILWTKNRKDFS